MASSGDIVRYIREVFKQTDGPIPLHAPTFSGNEKKYVLDTIDSTFVSSVGAYVTRFEKMMSAITGAAYAVATVNGTTALHLALIAGGVWGRDEVITQPLTFVATANAIKSAGANPVFVDVDRDTLGMSPDSLESFLTEFGVRRGSECFNKQTGRRIAACIPMHTFGLPLRIDRIAEICNRFGILLIEDAAESIGSYYKDKHTGTFGIMGTFSFNGNKTITCGGGGAIVTNDKGIALRLKHLSTTAKIPHPWDFVHDEVGYNYRMPNLNAALACAQLEQLDEFIENKRALAKMYQSYFKDTCITSVIEVQEAKANYWLNAIIFNTEDEKDAFLEYSNGKGVMTRPIWRLMNRLTMYEQCQTGNIENAVWLEKRVVNLPSSVRKMG